VNSWTQRTQLVGLVAKNSRVLRVVDKDDLASLPPFKFQGTETHMTDAGGSVSR
jgi:hypothetical protein